jgi:uncharacterized protein YhhL (DUF1145 family)
MNILFGILGALAFSVMWAFIIVNLMMQCQPDIALSCTWPWM